MKKLPLSLVAASVSVVSMQAHSKTDIKIDSNMVDYSAIDDIDQAFKASVSGDFIAENIESLSKAMTLDDKKITLSNDMLMAFKRDDATTDYGASTSSGISACYRNCHSACHGACHGSRGWR